MGGHEPVKPRPRVRINRQKFMHHGLGSNRHGQTVAGAIQGQGWRAGGRQNSQSRTGQRGLPALTYRSYADAQLRYKSTPRVAVRVVPLYEAEIVAEVEMRTKDVLTVKVALVAPAGTITLEGTLAAPLLLERKT